MINVNIQPINLFVNEQSNTDKKIIYELILEAEKDGSYPIYPFRFFFQENNKWIAVDNSDNCCWVEEFDESYQAIDWLKEIVS